MNGTLLAIVSVIYLGVAIKFIYVGNFGMALAFFSYALSNVGFIYATGLQ